MSGTLETTDDAFIARWQGQEGGQERANYALFLTELCDLKVGEVLASLARLGYVTSRDGKTFTFLYAA